jgi:hypothetical protein
MDASALDHHVYEGRAWSRPRRDPEPADDHVSAGSRGHRSAGSDEAGRAPVVSLVPDLDGHDRSADFRTQLVDAMHAAARAQHSRIVSDVEERQAAYVSAVHSRASAEVDAMRATADDVSSQVASWAAAELERIEHEREQKLDAARTDFQQRLDSHESRVEREIAEARARVTAYRAEIEAFFSQLDAEADPAVIAQLAARVPAPPDLEKLATAATPAVAEAVAAPPEIDKVATAATPAVAEAVTPAAAVGTVEPVTSTPTAAEAVAEAVTEAAAPATLDAATATPATFPAFHAFDPWAQGRDTGTGSDSPDDARRPAVAVRDDLGWDSDFAHGPETEPAPIPVAIADEHPADKSEPEPALAAEQRDERMDSAFPAKPAPVEHEPEPAAPTGKPKDLIRERLRYIAERRAALADVSAGTWPTEATPTSRPI